MAVVTADEAAIADASAAVVRGELVAFPTETVYGLGADATQGRAVAQIFAAKGRPRFNPLIVHVVDEAAAERVAVFDVDARKLAAAFWPGPLTLVLPRRAGCGISDLVTAGLDTIALRVPGHATAQALLRAAKVPVAAPSANRSGHVSPTTAQHVDVDLGDKVTIILDAGAARHGLESTVLSVIDGRVTLLRPGAVTAEAIEVVVGCSIGRALDAGDGPISPGQLESHYAPRAPVRLNATDVKPGEALLAFGRDTIETSGPVLNLSRDGCVIEAAANLFAGLRNLDQPGIIGIAVMPIPDHGLGDAINDRLRRASADRPGVATT